MLGVADLRKLDNKALTSNGSSSRFVGHWDECSDSVYETGPFAVPESSYTEPSSRLELLAQITRKLATSQLDGHELDKIDTAVYDYSWKLAIYPTQIITATIFFWPCCGCFRYGYRAAVPIDAASHHVAPPPRRKRFWPASAARFGGSFCLPV
jgi:hypothetical protein